MIWKLSERVWWGSYRCLECEDVALVKSVLCVAHNLDDVPYDPLLFGCTIPYFRLAKPDEELVSRDYYEALMRLLYLVRDLRWHPLLVHCRAGQHRSPQVAIVAESVFSNRPYAEVLVHARKLRPDIDCKQAFASSLASMHATFTGQ